jgi:hypothetical protein
VTVRPGRHRRPVRRRLAELAGLVVALVAAGLLVGQGPPGRAAPAAAVSSGVVSLAAAWPRAAISSTPGRVADGTPYAPALYLDARTSVGIATGRDGTARLLLRDGDRPPVELRRLPGSQNPQFAGFTAAGDDLVWAESTVSADGRGQTRIWRAGWRTGRRAAPLTGADGDTGDTGDVVFFNSQYDLVLAGGRVYWAAAARTDDPQTEVRSVPLRGGAVSTRRVPGAYSLGAWPWLVSAANGQAGPVGLLNLSTGQKITVPSAATELVTCSSAWCRVLVLSASAGPVRFDLMRPDGSQRQRVAGATASAAVQDVALLDRFEVVSMADGKGSATSSQRLLVYDARARRLVQVADGVGTVQARAGVLWWSTGDNEALTWHALDLRTLG